MFENQPIISVIIPCFNQGAFIEDCVNSCFEAYSGGLEIIIVDDGSTETGINNYYSKLRCRKIDTIKIVKKSNGGSSSARNVGIAQATGSFIQLLDADDILLKNKLDIQIEQMKNSCIDISITDYYCSDSSILNYSINQKIGESSDFELYDFLFKWERGFSIPIHTALFRSEILKKEIAFDESIGKEDWLFWVELKLADKKISYIPLRLCNYRMHDDNKTRSWKKMGSEWLKTADKINKLVQKDYPEFYDESLKWYKKFYESKIQEAKLGIAKKENIPNSKGKKDIFGYDNGLVLGSNITKLKDTGRKISVIIPIYNNLTYLRFCILSAVFQTVRPGEIVCVNDASTEKGVVELLNELSKKYDIIKVINNEKNLGIGDTQNVAIKHAKGEYIAFLDCDDMLARNAIESVSELIFKKKEKFDYYFSDRMEIDLNNKIIRRANYGGYNNIHINKRQHKKNLINYMIASHLKVIKRNSIIDVGGFSSFANGVQDWDMALKIAEHGKLYYLNEAIYYYRVHENGISQLNRCMMFKKTNQVRRNHQKREGEISLPKDLFIEAICKNFGKFSGAGENIGEFKWNKTLKLWEDKKLKIAILNRKISPERAYEIWKKWNYLVFIINSDASGELLGFLREFNSYFDLIVCLNSFQWNALNEYTWKEDVLVMIDDLLLNKKFGP